jgi:formylglycine-generating enzyme required for sulfatase activity
MGSVDFYPEEGPVHQATVEGLWVDRAPVSNAEFAAFVADTGYVTTAEQPLDPAVFPDLDDYSAGSMVFRPTDGPVDLGDWREWVGLGPGCFLACPSWARQRPGGTRRPSGRTGQLRRREGVLGLGRQGAADRGRVGALCQGADFRVRSTRGATIRVWTISSWPTPGKATFRTRTPAPRAGPGPRRSAAAPRTATAWSMSRAMSGS